MFYLILFVISAGILVPYGIELICVFWYPDRAVGIGEWNQFVSIVLGVVATVLSIISMIMSFKNYDDAFHLQDKYDKTLQEVVLISQNIKNLDANIKSHGLSSTRAIKEDSDGAEYTEVPTEILE